MRYAPTMLLPLLLLSAAGCGVPTEDHTRVVNALDAEKAARADEAKRHSADEAALRAEVDALKTKLADTEARVATLEGEKGSLAESLGASAAELEAARARAAELEKKTKEFEDLSKDLKDEIAAGRIELLGNLIRMKEAILFETGKSEIGADGAKALSVIAKALKKFKTTKVFEVTGHTDNVGGDAYNWELSTDRALAVVLFLRKAGVPPKMLAAAGFGEHQPVCPKNDTPECKATNRRIDIIVLPAVEFSPMDLDAAKKLLDKPPPPPPPAKGKPKPPPKPTGKDKPKPKGK